MELRNTLNASAIANTTSETAILSMIHDAGWNWFNNHKDDTLFHKFIFTIKVKDIRIVFERVFGAE